MIARAFILTEGDALELQHLPRAVAEQEGVLDWPVLSLAGTESRTIKVALEATGGEGIWDFADGVVCEAEEDE